MAAEGPETTGPDLSGRATGLAEGAGGVWSPARRGLTAALVASVTLVGSETLAVATVMPAVAEDLGYGGYGLAFSVFSVGSIVGVLLAGPATDRVGPWRPFLLGMTLFAVGLAVGAAAPHLGVLIAGRLLQGLGAGAIPAVSYACIGRAYPEAVKPRMLAVLSTAWVLPGVVGPGLAGLVAEHVGWRWVFGGLLPLVALAIAAASGPLRRLAPDTVGSLAGLPVLDALRFAAGVGLFIAAIDRLQPFSALAVLSAAAMVLIGMVAAGRPAQRLLPGGWWKARPGIAAAVVARALVAYAFVAVDAFVPLALTDVRGRSLIFASLAVSIATLVWSVGSWVADRAVARTGPGRLAAYGALLVMAGVLLQTLLLFDSVPVFIGLPGVAVAALGMGVAFTPLAMLVLDQQEEANAGVASSWMSLFELLGFAFGPAVGGALVAAAPAPPGLARNLTVAFLLAAVVAGAAVALRGRLVPAAARSGASARSPRR